MPNVNQASLREEFATLKGQFEQLSAAGKVSEELRTLVQALLLLLELLMAVFMEKHTPKSSRNSGLPPSQTGKDAQTTSQPGSRAKVCEQTRHRAGNTRFTRVLNAIRVSVVPDPVAELIRLDVRHHHRARFFRGEPSAHRLTDSIGAAGDHHNFIFDLHK